MSDLTVAVTITRTELGFSNLTLDPATCEVVTYDPGPISKRRVTQGSPTVDGAVETGSVRDMRLITLVLRFKGSSKTVLDANLQTVLNAFEQSSYHLSVQLDDATVVWDCWDAEYRPTAPDGDGVHKFGLMATPRRQAYVFTIPAQPAPISGVY
jgi:hypothetical protein